MRVLLDCRMTTWTGVGRYSQGLARALGEMTDELRVIQVVRSSDDAPIPDGEMVRSRFSPLSPAGMVEFGAIQRGERADITHCLHFPTPLPAHSPLVVTLHDLTPLIVDGVMPVAWRRAVYAGLNRRAVRVADAVITPSAHTAADVERLIPAAQGKTHVTLEGVDDFAVGPAAELTGELARITAAPYVLSMGATRAHKDLPTLLRAFERIASERPKLRLLLVGAEQSGFVSATIPHAAEAIRSRVVFTGRVSDSELRALYANAAVFAFPSRYEGFGLPPLEAMAMGAPVVCADSSSLPEVVGGAALMHPVGDPVALADAVCRVLDEPTLRDRLVAAGHARAAGLTWSAVAHATFAVYREVCSKTAKES